MTKIFLRSLSVVLVLAACSHSGNSGSPSPQKSSSLGFYQTGDANVPTAVRSAAQSVYRIITPAGQLSSVRTVFGDYPIAKIIEHTANMPTSADLTQEDKDVMLYQVKECAKRAQPLDCQVYSGNKISSAYSVGRSFTRTPSPAILAFALKD